MHAISVLLPGGRLRVVHQLLLAIWCKHPTLWGSAAPPPREVGDLFMVSMPKQDSDLKPRRGWAGFGELAPNQEVDLPFVGRFHL